MRNFKLLIVPVGLILFANSCNKQESGNENTLRELYKIYKDGEINECLHNGKFVYSAGLNPYDAGVKVYDKDGKQIGTCNYAWGQVDDICQELEACKTVYRVEGNIWGQSAVDKYGLGN